MHINRIKEPYCSFMEKEFQRAGAHPCAHIHTHAHTWRHTSSLTNPSTNSPLVEGVHCFSFILISPSPLFKIHIRFSLSWPQSEALKQSITLLMLFVSPDLSLSMESTPLSWRRVGERQTLTWGNCFLSQAILTPSPPPLLPYANQLCSGLGPYHSSVRSQQPAQNS